MISPPAPAAPIQPEQWSAISPGSLGYKVAVRAAAGQLQFIPVLGWITCTARTPEGTLGNTFHAVIRGPNHLPIVANFANGYQGVFEEELTEAQAETLIEAWKVGAAPQPKTTQGPARA
jgi:hypothetical protein